MKVLTVLMMIAEVEMLSWEPGPQSYCHQAFMPSTDCKCMITKYGTPETWKFHWECPDGGGDEGGNENIDESNEDSNEELESTTASNQDNGAVHGGKVGEDKSERDNKKEEAQKTSKESEDRSEPSGDNSGEGEEKSGEDEEKSGEDEEKSGKDEEKIGEDEEKSGKDEEKSGEDDEKRGEVEEKSEERERALKHNLYGLKYPRQTGFRRHGREHLYSGHPRFYRPGLKPYVYEHSGPRRPRSFKPKWSNPQALQQAREPWYEPRRRGPHAIINLQQKLNVSRKQKIAYLKQLQSKSQ